MLLIGLAHYIGVGTFRIGVGQGLDIRGGGQGGTKFPARIWRRKDVDATLWRRIGVISTSCAHKIFNKSVPNNYISRLNIWYYRNSRIELGTFVLFSCFTLKLKEKVGGLLGGPKGILAPLSQITWGPGPPAPPPTPCSYVYALDKNGIP